MFSQIEGRGIAPVCATVTGNPTFPPRNEPFDFRLRLEAKYRDELRSSASQTAVDIEGDIVWTQEYLRYRVSTCGHMDAINRVVAQIDGRGVQPDCTPVVVEPTPPPPTTTCSYALNPSGNSVGVNGGTFSVNVSVQAGCGWQLSSNVPWLRPSTTSGSGSATVSYTVDANAAGGRNGRISLSGTGGGSAAHDVSQAGTTTPPPTVCAYTVAPTTLNVISNGGSVSFTVTTNAANCAWTAASQAGFITITSGTSGSTTGTVNLSVAANTSAARSGTVLVSYTGGSQSVTVNQSGAANPTASASYTPDPCTITNGGATLNCTFNGSGSSAGSGTITAYIWSYLGTTVETAGATHAPNFGGCGLTGGQVVNVPVTLTVRNSSNVMSSAFPFTVAVRKVNSCGFGQ